MKTCLCLLTFNEIYGCTQQIDLLPVYEFDEVLCIDGGSSDGTKEYLESKKIKVYIQPVSSLNAAYHYAYKMSQADFIVFFHPKGTISTEELFQFRKFINQGFDLIIGSRNSKDATNDEDDRLFKPRKWFVIALSKITALLWKREGDSITDILHGFRGISRKAFFLINPLPIGTAIDLEIVIGAYKKKLKRIEFTSKEYKRTIGQTHFKAIPTGYKLIKHMCKEIFGTTS